ncbi:MAG TPA: hypothetical protein VFB12_04905 [Ktedonobacteraceae bacterium]|nr:hypothetical protein [Ktedonobacteraceae bacterium]
MEETEHSFYDEAKLYAQEAIELCLHGKKDYAQEFLHRTHTMLRRLSGDLPIVGQEEYLNRSFATRSFEEAEGWGWYELAAGIYGMTEERPGTSLVHFKRAWRIWRPWSSSAMADAERYEASCERLRAGLWLGEAWARIMSSDRTRHAANAVLRATLSEIERIGAQVLIEETIGQQRLLPPAPPGSPAYSADGKTNPYICSIANSEKYFTHERKH